MPSGPTLYNQCLSCGTVSLAFKVRVFPFVPVQWMRKPWRSFTIRHYLGVVAPGPSVVRTLHNDVICPRIFQKMSTMDLLSSCSTIFPGKEKPQVARAGADLQPSGHTLTSASYAVSLAPPSCERGRATQPTVSSGQGYNPSPHFSYNHWQVQTAVPRERQLGKVFERWAVQSFLPLSQLLMNNAIDQQLDPIRPRGLNLGRARMRSPRSRTTICPS